MKRAANVGLTVLLSGLVALLIAVVAIPAATGTQVVSITRNSMQEVIPFGSLIYVHPEKTYNPGDIVTFQWNGNLVTHEVIEWTPNPANAALDGSYLRTKGTSNAEPDPYVIAKDQIVGKVVAHVPVMGVVMKTLDNQSVRAFVALLALFLWWGTGRKPRQRLLKKVHVVYPAQNL